MRKTCPYCNSWLVPHYIENSYICERCNEDEEPKEKPRHLGQCDNCDEKAMLNHEDNFCSACEDAMKHYMEALWAGISYEEADKIYWAVMAKHKARMTNPATFEQIGKPL